MLSSISHLFAVAFLFLAMSYDRDSDIENAVYMMLWAIYFMINAIFLRQDENNEQ